MALLKELTEGLIEDDKLILQQLISTISNWKNDLMTPAQAAASAKGERDRIFAHCYGLYDAHMKACNVLDFDDLILLPTLLLQRNEEVRERWQNRIRYLLVDEYQDTNTSQYELVKLLVGKRARFTVVGDDDQSIYRARRPSTEPGTVKQRFSGFAGGEAGAKLPFIRSHPEGGEHPYCEQSTRL